MSINETVLEMHFHNPLMKLFQDTVGLGKGSFNFYKYSPQKECFIGFDQAYIKSDMTDKELFRVLRNSAMNSGYNLSNFFVGYFLQFKVVKEMQKRVRHTPSQIISRPHYRVSLDTQKNINTGFSQHELLYALNKNNNAMVYYACPMVFEKSELYKSPPDMSLLRFADLTDCPHIYDDNESHYIYFDDKQSNPIWCSDPVEGAAYTPQFFVNDIKNRVDSEEFRADQLKLLDALEGTEENVFSKKKEKVLNMVSESLTIIRYAKS